MSVSAWYVLKRRHLDLARRGFDIALVLAATASLAILVSGHGQAQKVAETQPAKLAAFEGHYESAAGAPLHLFGVPDSVTEQVDYGVAIPKLLSVLIHGDPGRSVIGLDQFAAEDRPPVGICFQSYHLMVALGMSFIGLTLLALVLRWRGRLYEQRWLMRVFVAAVVGPILGNQSGWVSAEVGRQPWVVYGLLRTKDAVSKSVPAEQVLGSIILFGVVYTGLFALWLFVLHSKIRTGPEEPGEPAADGPPSRLLRAAAESHAEGNSLTGVDAGQDR
jgi:cytochrome d ubiquinol oxidase subunit I